MFVAVMVLESQVYCAHGEGWNLVKKLDVDCGVMVVYSSEI